MADDSPPSPLAPITRAFNHALNNLSATLSSASTTDYIRLTAIIGGYLLIRPYLQKLGARAQERDHERTVDATEESSMAATGVKARVVAGEDDSSDDDDSDGEGWGRKRRLQQRAQRAARRREVEERTAAGGFDDDEDKDIEEYLQT